MVLQGLLALTVSPQLWLAGLPLSRHWIFQVASGHAFCWKTKELIQGHLERVLEPAAQG